MNRLLQFLVVSLLIELCFCVPKPAQAELRLSGIFSNHVVLQRDRPAPIWGWANEHQLVTIHFAGQILSTTADGDGYWRVPWNQVGKVEI